MSRVINITSLIVVCCFCLFFTGVSNSAPDSNPMLNKRLISGATRGSLPEVEDLIKKGADINARGILNTTPLLEASSTVEDQPELVDFLLKNGAEIHAVNYMQETPLHLAVKYSRIETIKVLLRYKADPTLKNKEGKSSIDYARLDGNEEIISLLKPPAPTENKQILPDLQAHDQILKKLKGICYDSTEVFINEEDLKKDIASLKNVSEKIMTFSAKTSSWFASNSLSINDIPVYAGCCISYDKKRNDKEIKAIKHIAQTLNNSSIKCFIIGREALSQEKVSVSDLIMHIKEIRKVTRLPITTSETYDYWLKYPELVNQVDFISLYIYPFWEGVTIRHAADYILGKVNKLKRIYPDKKIIIGETGWPACGPERGEAVPGLANQASFYRDFTIKADKNNLEYFCFNGFDEYALSDAPTGINCNWGLYTKGRTLKKQIYTALLNKTSPGFTNSLDMAFVYIHPNTYMMGENNNYHKVTITNGYYIQTTEVTRKQWTQVMGEIPAQFGAQGDDYPVVNISWNDCQIFIEKLNQIEKTTQYRLPTEAEWEYACRSGSSTSLPWGEKKDTCQYANIADLTPPKFIVGNRPFNCTDSYTYSAPIASFGPNEFGLYDMIGNVWEWCQDRFGSYPLSEVTDPKGPENGKLRIIRGGGWDTSSDRASVSYRGQGRPDKTGMALGFRLVYDSAPIP